MYKKLLVVIIFLSIIVFCIVASATNSIKIIMNGQEIVSDFPPQNSNGRILVPISTIAKAFDADVKWDAKNETVVITKEKDLKVNNNAKIISSLASEKVNLYGVEEKDGVYNSVYLEVKGIKKHFDWQPISNQSFAPILSIDDLNKDGEKELVIKLTTQEGTGVNISEVHVLSLRSLTEIEVEKPLEIINKYVKTNITPNGVNITINGELLTVNKQKIETEQTNWFSNISFGNNVDFIVIQNELTSIIGAQISPNTYIGNIYIIYQFKDGKYQAKSVSFKLL
jgi:hypothetical protein